MKVGKFRIKGYLKRISSCTFDSQTCFTISGVMICIETHFRVHRALLLLIGLWPYQQSKLARLQAILLFGTLISIVISQLAVFVTKECTPDVIIKVFSMALISICLLIEYNGLWINIDNMKYLLERLQYIFNELEDENEIAIMKKYGNDANRFTTFLLSLTTCGVFIVTLLLIWPRIFNIVSHKNESKSHDTMQLSEYIIYQERYFYLILLHISVAIFVGGITVIATGTMLTTYIKHICGMLKIVSYRIDQAMAIKMITNNNHNNEITIHKKIIYAVDIHCKAMKFSELVSSTFEVTLFLMILFSVSALSVNLFAISWNASLGNREESVLHFMFVIAISSCMFLGNYIGQELLDHSDYIFFIAYNVQWYIAPVHIQKLIFFILQRGNKTFNINIAGLFVPSLECFATLAETSMSYFTVLYSMQN